VTLDDIKRAAKRLRKHTPELAPAAGSPLTHTQALDIVARLHGFRHYREAESRFGEMPAVAPLSGRMTSNVASSEPRQVAASVLADTGGIAIAAGLHFDFANIRISAKVPFTIEGPSGCGKSFLAKELICQALAQGTKVRILDTTREYRHFTLALGGQYFHEPKAADFQEAWNSDAPFVVVDASAYYPHDTLFAHLQGMPQDVLFVCEDINPDDYVQLNAPTLRIKHRHGLRAEGVWRGFRHKPESRWQWSLQLPEQSMAPLTATFKFSAARDEVWLPPCG